MSTLPTGPMPAWFRWRPAPSDRKLLIVAPMSGHYATLLRGTVEAFLPNHDVHITDWSDARMVPLAAGAFRSEAFDRGADVGPLRYAAPRHRRSLPAEPRCPHYRLVRCPHGSVGGRRLQIGSF